MKVTQDACILGALAPLESARTILDIGTGTGVLALMAAQRAPLASIVALEPDGEAAEQARENVAASPFRTITVQNTTVQSFADETQMRFDHIICNPPFHQQQPRSLDPAKRMAWHAEHLNFDDLARAIDTLLSDSGCATLLCPDTEYAALAASCARNDLHLAEKIMVRDRADRPVRRIISVWARHAVHAHERVFTARSSPSSYSAEMLDVIKDFYLESVGR